MQIDIYAQVLKRCSWHSAEAKQDRKLSFAGLKGML